MDNLLEPEFEPAFTAWKAKPDRINGGEMLKAVDPVIRSAVKLYGRGETSQLLHTRARRMALEAFQSYDPARAKLKTHLMSRLQGLRRASVELGQDISIPETIRLDQGHLRETSDRLKDWLGREPSDAELADESGMSLKRISHIRGASGGVAESSLRTMSDEGQDVYQPAVKSNDLSGWHEFVYHSLQPVDQTVLEYTLGLHGKPVLSNQALAAKLRITPAAVSQRKSKIQQQLNQHQSLGIL